MTTVVHQLHFQS